MAIRSDVPSIEITQHLELFNERGIMVRVEVPARFDLKPEEVVSWHSGDLKGMATVERVVKERNSDDLVYLKKNPTL